MKEIWKQTNDKRVMVSNLGRVKKNGIIKECACDSEGYYRIGINGKTERIHRLVAELFIPRKEGRNSVNHKNHNKKDNRVVNLEWSTNRENSLLAGRAGRLGKRRGNNMKVIGIHLQNQIAWVFKNQYDAADAIGCHNSEINKNLHGLRRTCHGYKFVYFDDYKPEMAKSVCSGYADDDYIQMELDGYETWRAENERGKDQIKNH